MSENKRPSRAYSFGDIVIAIWETVIESKKENGGAFIVKTLQ